MADKPKRIPWLKWFPGGFIFLLLLLIIFYQPILFGLTQFVGQQVARSQKLSLEFRIHGSVISDLYLEDVHLEPLPGNNSFPVELLRARRVGARYNLLNLVRKDFLNVVDLIELKDIDLALRPSPAPPQQKPAGPLRLAPIIPQKIDVSNVNVRVHEDKGDFVIRNLALQFAQDRDGYLALDRLTVPPLGEWQNLHASISAKQNILQLQGLSIEPFLIVNQLSLDLAALESGTVGAVLDAKVFDADLTAHASLTQQANAASSASIRLANLQLDKLQRLTSIPMSGTVPGIDFALTGDLQHPETWNGRVLFSANNFQYQTYRVDEASATVTLTQGTGRIDPVFVRSGPNTTSLTGNFRLPPDWSNFPARVSANLGLAMALVEPRRYLPEARGSAFLSGNVDLASGLAKGIIRVRATGLGTQAVEASTAMADVYAAATVPLEPNFWHSLAALVTAHAGEIRLQEAHVADLNGSLDLRNGSSAELSASMRSGKSSCDVNAHAPLPATNSAFDPKNIDGRLRFHVASISDFIEQQFVSGTLTAEGDLQVHDLQPNGYVKAAGTQLKYRDFIIPRLEMNANAAGRAVKLDPLHVSFDEKDYIDANGSATLADPFNYQAYARINFSDLKTFNALLKSFGPDPGLSGALNASFTGKGDLKSQIPEANLAVSGNQISYRGLVLQDVEINGDIKDKTLNLPTLKIVADPKNSISANGNARLIDPVPYRFNANIDLDDLGFLNPLLKSLGQEGGLSGKIRGTGSAQSDSRARAPTGTVQLAGEQIKYRDLLVQNLTVQAKADGNQATVQNAAIYFDPNNYVNLNGNAALADPFNYEAYGRINFSDLKTFNALLKSFGPDPGLSGTLNASFTGKGDLKNQIPEANLAASGNQISYRGLVLQDVEIRGDIKDKRLNLATLKVIADPKNSISANGNAGLTDPFPYGFNANIDLNDLGFLDPLLKSLGQEGGLSGKLHGTGWAQSDSRARGPTGVVQLAGEQIKYRDLLMQSLSAQAKADGNQATLQNAAIYFDPSNYINLNGNAALADPFNYEAYGRINFSDLKTFNAVLKSFGPNPGLSGTLNASLTARGNLKSQIPETNLAASGNQISYRGLVLQDVEIRGDLKDKRLNLPTLKIVADPKNSINANGNARLTDPLPYSFNANIDLNDLGFLNPLLKSLGQEGGMSGKLHATGSAQSEAWDWAPSGAFQLAGEQIKYRDLLVQNLSVQAKADGKQATLQNAAVYFDPNNYINLNGNAALANPFSYQAYGRVNFSDLKTFNALLKSFGPDPGLSGTLNASLTAKGDLQSQIPEANLAMNGKQIRYRGLTLREVEIGGDVKDKKLNLPVLKIVADQNNSVNATGNAVLTDPFPYDSNLNVDFKDLGFLNPLLKSFGQDLDLGGMLSLTWSGRGELKNSVGNARLVINGLRTKQVKDVQVQIEGNYHGLTADIPKFQAVTPFGTLDAVFHLTPESIQMPSLTVRRGQNVLTGNAQLPLNLEPGAKLPIAFDRPIELNFRADRVSLASFQSGKPQVTGNVGLTIQASGTLRDLALQIQSTADDLRAATTPTFAAATARLQISLAQNTLAIDGGLRQADIQPLQIQGKIPLDLEKIINAGKLPLDTPLQLAVKWPDTNLAFVRRLTPFVRVVEGRVAIDANVSGTLEKPSLAGQVRAQIARFKAQTDVVPPLSDFNLNIGLNQDRVVINQLGGYAAGGPFSVRGSVDLSKGTNPQLDLTITGRQVLLTRSDNIIVRSNLDLTIRGPLAAAEVAGKVGLINSKFFQDIDILPLNLPGQPAPQPPGPPPNVSIDTPPLRDWKFNIKIQTDDPFRVQSNLARGVVLVDLQAGGTGLKPSLTGFAHIKQLTASLPFSHMEITGSYVNFNPGGNPLDPQLNIIGRSTVRDYEVTMRIFGPVSNFQVLFDSSPPLSQGDIATLLATGATSSEFVKDPSLLAGRAAFILARQLFSKVFKQQPSAQQQDFLNRLQVDIIPGQRVGTQDISARFSVTRSWQIVAEFGSVGNVSGRLRYLIRFR